MSEKNTTKVKAPVKYFETVDKKGSGFVMDGTKGTIYQQELSVPAIRWIPSKGRTAVTETDPSTGKPVKAFKEIKYLNGCDSIDPEIQKLKGFVDRPFEDKIPMENGFMTVVREGDTISLYDYLDSVFYNQDNPDRPDTATAIYREVKLDKKAETLLDDDELQTQAKSLVYQLRVNTGDKKIPYKYNQDRINTFCQLVGVFDVSPERQLILLLQEAMSNPKQFLETIVKAEQTVITEVSHALQLNVIQFDKNTAQFVEGNKIIFTVEGDRLKSEQKITQLASWLSTPEGNTVLTELRVKLEIEKDKQLA